VKRLIAVGISLALLAGCGTIGGLTNPDYPGKVYVGVRHDINLSHNILLGMPGWMVIMWDMPFSAVLDTVMLPGTLIYELFRK
jgi:uncharacterized protein YceK